MCSAGLRSSEQQQRQTVGIPMQRQQRYSFRSNIVCAAAAVESSPAGAAAMPKLSDLPLQAIINPQVCATQRCTRSLYATHDR